MWFLCVLKQAVVLVWFLCVKRQPESVSFK